MEKEKNHKGKHSLPTLPSHRKIYRQPGGTIHFAIEDGSHTNLLKRWWRRLTDASTGSPSDGIGGTSEGSASVAAFLSTQGQAMATKEANDADADWHVDEIVVEIDDQEQTKRPSGGSRTAGTASDGEPGMSSSREEVRSRASARESARGFARVWHAVYAFFSPRFDDSTAESEYQKLSWYQGKKLLFFSVVYLYINWFLYLILNHSLSLYEKIVYYGPFSLLTFPLGFMIFFDLPQRTPRFFQLWLVAATWYCAITEIVQTRECRFFKLGAPACGNKDFLAMLYYATGFPTLVLFAGSARFYHAIAQVIVAVLLFAVVIPVQGVFARNVVSFILYSLFIQAFHWDREKTSRRMFRLNSQLKTAYKAQQQSQIQESAANQAKRRFASYLFHEVRVPLNTAMLAFQNLQSEGALRTAESGNQALEVFALDSSLTTMQQVLNDVLDLQRMDAGKFEMTMRPFNFHRHIQTLLGGVKIATDAKNLTLTVDLDPKIDMLQNPAGGDGLVVIGDPIRLQQIISNLTSNSVKFTTSGEIKVVTRLLSAGPALCPVSSGRHSEEKPRGTECLTETAKFTDTTVVEPCMTFRIEVHDSGPGIRPSDLAGSRLFRPFAQTRVGKASGEGSGLGLAIVRQIVALSGGRLGIRSKRGAGACFWFELSYRVASPEEVDDYSRTLANPNTLPPDPPRPSPSSTTLGYLPLLTPLPQALESPPLFPHPPTPPMTTSQPSAAPIPSSPSLPMDTPEITEEPLTALVVDDDPLTRVLFTRMLTRLGAVVETACNGQECVDILLGVPPDQPPRSFDLICLDNSMPVLNGEEAVRMLRSEGRTDLYVVGCTGNALREDQQAYIRAGADRIIAKPVLLRDVVDILAVAGQRKAEAWKAEGTEGT